MATNLLISLGVILAVTILHVVLFWVILPRIPSLREWKLNRIRKTALKYIDLLDRTMKSERYSRQQRRQFWREFVHDGRFIND